MYKLPSAQADFVSVGTVSTATGTNMSESTKDRCYEQSTQFYDLFNRKANLEPFPDNC